MRILGIDPGYAIIGFAIIEVMERGFKFIDCGVIVTDSKLLFPQRLEKIFKEMIKIFEKYKPDEVAIECIYFQNNQKTAICVAQARGVLVLAAKVSFLEVFEYAPAQVKSKVAGDGKARKIQIIEATKSLLSLDFDPTPDDAADAIAVAICHAVKMKSKGLVVE